MTRPVVVQHSFGELGTGGPIMALQQVLASSLAEKYTFIRMHQISAIGGLNAVMIRDWAMKLRRIKPDLVHVRGLGNEGFHGVVAARLAGCPRILLSVHGTARDLEIAPKSFRIRFLTNVVEPCTLRLATHIVTVCHSAAERAFLRNYHAKFSGVVPNGVALPDIGNRPMRNRVRRELGVSEGELVLVVVGRLSIEKGHLVLAQALKELRFSVRRLTLVLVGDGPDRSIIESAYGAVDGLSYRALGNRADVPEILQASDIFVFPTLHENLSNALLEAMAASLPVVASAVGGNVEVLERGGGVLIPAYSPGQLAGALDKMLGDPELRAAYGVEARKVITERYTSAHMVQELDRTYAAILQKAF